MPQIPGVPTLDPVAKPMMSPSQAARPGETIAGLGQEFFSLSMEGMALQGHIRKAQEHVDKLAAQNELNAAYLRLQDDLLKTTNARDVDSALKQAHDNIERISHRWSASPAVRDIQLSAESYLAPMAHQAQVRQVHLMGQENQVSLDELSKNLLQEVTDPVTALQAVQKYSQALDESVQAKLQTEASAREAKDQFRKATQFTLLDRAFSSPLPAVNEAGVNDLIQHPEHYPDLTPHERAAYIEKGEDAFRKNTRWAKEAGIQQTLDRELPDFRQQFSRMDGTFDLAGAMKEVNRREALPATAPQHLSVAEGDALRGHLNADNSDREKMFHDDSDKARDEIFHMLNSQDPHRLQKARVMADLSRKVFERGRSDYYPSIVNAIRGYESTARMEARADRADKLNQWQTKSWSLFGQIQSQITSGKPVDSVRDIWGKVGPETGLTPEHARELVAINSLHQKDASFRQALSLIDHSPLFSANTDETNMQKAKLAERLRAEVTKDNLEGFAITERAKKLLDDQGSESIVQKIMRIFGGSQSETPQTPDVPKEGDTKTNAAGDRVVYKGGKWQLQPSTP